MPTHPKTSPSSLLRNEWFLAIGIVTGAIFYFYTDWLVGDLSNPLWLGIVSVWLFGAILGSALCVVRHADAVADRLGEPYGTLVLTLSITSVEVLSISAIMMHGGSNPTLVRDTLFSVIMIILNGMVGLALLLGALRHKEQFHNLQGANAYLGVIIPLAVLSLVLPDYTRSDTGSTLSPLQQIILVLMTAGLYAIFLMLQTGRHRGYFVPEGEAAHEEVEARDVSVPLLPHAILLLAYIGIVVFLAEEFAKPVDFLTETLGAPMALGGIIIAVLVATPEAIGAIKAAMANHLQKSVNIFLGSVLSTIGLTVPAMLLIARLTGHELTLGLERTDLVMLLLTLASSVVTFASGRTNMLQGAVHMLLFLLFLLLIFQG
ncbi:calcium:proton antiporter [Aestuariivirga sp.]|uniref:calcium:proton antiporter n=1 Tax=Aestuariivirga sp. TaxID=2650926 RepID=UPI0039E3656B